MKETLEGLGLKIEEFSIPYKLPVCEINRCILYFSRDYSQCYIRFKRLTENKINKQITRLNGEITLLLPDDLEELKYFINL